MNDVTHTIKPKSDQLNADDLITGAIIIEVTSVVVKSSDQPISIHFVGDNNKPYKPCLSMRRALVMAWGKDGNNWVGKKIQLYLDKDVTWAGQKVGGIRISHMSHINEDFNALLTKTRGKKAVHKIQKLEIEDNKNQISAGEYSSFDKRFKEASTAEELNAIAGNIEECNYNDESRNGLMEIFTVAKTRINNIKKED